VIPQWGQNPTFCQEDSGFDLCFISGFEWTGRDDSDSIMLCEVLVSGIDIRLIAAGFGDACFEVVRDDDLWDTAKVFQGMDMGIDPTGKVLR